MDNFYALTLLIVGKLVKVLENYIYQCLFLGINIKREQATSRDKIFAEVYIIIKHLDLWRTFIP